MKQTILADAYDAFMAQEHIAPPLVNTNTDEIPAVYKNFKYPISSYPILISEAQSKKLEEVSVLIPRLLQKVLEMYFENDVQKITDFYFNGDEMLGQFSVMCQERGVPVSCRLDLSLTTDGFKVMEVNFGSSIGGIGLQNFDPILRKTHTLMGNGDTSDQFKFRQSQDLYMEFLVKQIQSYTKTTASEINLFLISDAEASPEHNKMITDLFNAILQKELAKTGKTGTVFMDTISSLKMKTDGLYKGDKPIHAVLILDFSLRDISPDLFRGFIMNRVYFPDHLGVMYVRDKRNLALMRRLAEARKFNGIENDLVLEYVPWTEIIAADASVTYEGKTQNIVTLLQTEKDKFVIKVIDGLQGDDVYIGKFLSTADWEKAIEKAVTTNKFIAQEFSDSLNLLAPDLEGNWVPQKLVWGAFGFGDIYGGTWVRMAPVKRSAGVINSAAGAVEALVYELNV
jgi:hypothetical protein